MKTATPGLSWLGVFRLGLVQTALGAIVVLSTSLLNRVMSVELGLAQIFPGALIALHYAVQVTRPSFGHRSDGGRRRTPWILGGIVVLALGSTAAAGSVALMATSPTWGLVAAILAFVAIGLGVGASGTTLLALLATEVAPGRRAAAASIVFTMMIAGFVVTTIGASAFLSPFTLERMIAVCATVGALAVLLAAAALWGLERPNGGRRAAEQAAKPGAHAPQRPLREAIADVWADPQARIFTYFVFVAMLAYQMQDAILEPFSGFAFGYAPDVSTRMSGHHHSGVLLGMLTVAGLNLAAPDGRIGSLALWRVAGCAASGFGLLAIAWVGLVGAEPLFAPTLIAFGFFNGAFTVAALGSMMALAGAGGPSKEGVRMGVWGAAQALGFGLAGVVSSGLADLLSLGFGDRVAGNAAVFAVEAGLFIAAALLALRIVTPAGARIGALATDVDGARAARPSPVAGAVS